MLPSETLYPSASLFKSTIENKHAGSSHKCSAHARCCFLARSILNTKKINKLQGVSYKLWGVQMIVTPSVAPPVQMPDRPAHTQACAQDCSKLIGARTIRARNGTHMPGARSVLRAKNASVPTPIVF